MFALFVRISFLELWCALDRRWGVFGRLLLAPTLEEKVCHHGATTFVHSHHVPAHLNLLLLVHLFVLEASRRFHSNRTLPGTRLSDNYKSMNWLSHFGASILLKLS